jgi:hypothetical protein
MYSMISIYFIFYICRVLLLLEKVWCCIDKMDFGLGIFSFSIVERFNRMILFYSSVRQFCTSFHNIHAGNGKMYQMIQR